MTNNPPFYVLRVLEQLVDVRPVPRGWDARCPCPNHNPTSDHVGDQHPSLHVALGDDGRILMKCRVGCAVDEILDAIGLDRKDLFCPPGEALPQLEVNSTCRHRTDIDLVDAAYQAVLVELSLSDEHRKDLQRRGLTDCEIDRRQYRSLRNVDRGRAGKAAAAKAGDNVLSVPGFTRGTYGVTLTGNATGLLVPVRALEGRIQALKIRQQGDPKYLYLSDAANTSSGSPIHVPLGIMPPVEIIRVTEGELKADVCMSLDATPTIGVPGVTQWKSAMPILKELHAKTVVIAYDAPDVRSKLPVLQQAEAFYHDLKTQGFEVELEDWQ